MGKQIVEYPYNGFCSTIKVSKPDTYNKLDDSQMLSEKNQNEKDYSSYYIITFKEHFRKCGLVVTNGDGIWGQNRVMYYKGHEELWSMTNIFIILMVVVISWI